MLIQPYCALSGLGIESQSNIKSIKHDSLRSHEIMKLTLNVIRVACVCNLAILCRIEKVSSHHAEVDHRVWQHVCHFSMPL